jgi:hypothetical protein
MDYVIVFVVLFININFIVLWFENGVFLFFYFNYLRSDYVIFLIKVFLKKKLRKLESGRGPMSP